MKRYLFGVMVFLLGMVNMVISFTYTIMNPGIYNNIGGLLGSFLCADTLIPFIIFTAITGLGLYICWYEAYCKK